MKRYIEGRSRAQMVLIAESLDDFIGEDNPVRTVQNSIPLRRNSGDASFKDSTIIEGGHPPTVR